MNVQLDPPRWPGGPLICPTANLPAFPDKKASAAFRDANSPGCTVIEEWICTACGLVHFWAHALDPSGASSGTTRSAKHAESARNVFLKSYAAKTMPKVTAAH